MSDLHIRFRNARREPLNDKVDVKVRATTSNRLVTDTRGVPGKNVLKVGGVHPGLTYLVTAFPTRHRPVGRVVMVPPDGPAQVELYFPLHPDHVQPAFPAYAELPEPLTRVLERSTLEGRDGTGQALYDALAPIERAGLLNLFCKMDLFGFDDHNTVWSAVDRVFRIRPDRIFADVQVTLRDRVKTAVADDRFREVSGKLHTPPHGYRAAGSFKTDERYGNLQLSFFASEQAPLTFRVDADIDDAAGLAHTFQVLRNWVRDATTNPYDIHQILVFRQEANPPYDLA